jgi:hypothetical protein
VKPISIGDQKLESLAGYRHCVERICAAWPGFLERRAERLQPHPLLGVTPEKITESILEDLFTNVLDWPLAGCNPQVEHADIVLSNLGIRWLVVEAKRPGSLAWNAHAVDKALEQALGYAAEQGVHCVAISDGEMLYATDRAEGGTRDRMFVSLGATEPPPDLWWLSVQGIYRPRELASGAAPSLLPHESAGTVAAPTSLQAQPGVLLHPKYKLPARCFAYAGDHANPRTWKLPYLLSNESIDAKRLPKAIQCILTNYRGARVSGIPEEAIPAVLARLARAAVHAGHMPPVASNPAPVYRQLAEALEQLGISLLAE